MNELDGLRYGTRLATHMGCLEESAPHLGLDLSPGWLYGGTGHAFVVSLGPDLCPSGPHCWRQGPILRLSRNLGMQIGGVASPRATPDLCKEAWDLVRRSIDEGLPCYGWHWEWLLIHGYDEKTYLTSGRVPGPEKWQEFGAGAIGFIEIYAVRPGPAADDETTVREALAFAMHYARSYAQWTLEGYVGGLDAYDVWMEGLRSGKVSPDGAAYHAAIWAECRQLAAAFLGEARKRIGRHGDLFGSAVSAYAEVAERLEQVSALFPFLEGQTEAMQANIENAGRRQRAVAALDEARQAEADGLQALSAIVAVL